MTGSSPKRLIVYDLDGTLVDTEADIAESVNYMLTTLGVAPRARSEIRGFVGRGLRDLVASALRTQDPGRIDQAVERFGEHYGLHLLDQSRLYPNSLAVLEHFKGRAQAILTNKPDPFARDLLAGLGVAHYFLEIIAGNSTHPKKPNPAGILALMASCGAAASNTLLIGDSPIDIEAGRRAGVLTVAVGHGFCGEEELRTAGPDALVADFAGLLDLATRSGW